MAARFIGCKHSVPEAAKLIARKGKNGFDEFPGVKFTSPDAQTNSWNIGQETDVKTNWTFLPWTIEPVNGYNYFSMQI